MTKSLLVVFAVCFGQLVVAQSLLIEAATDEGLELFEEARMAVHETLFEKADDLLRVVVETEPDLAIAYAYRAAVDNLLFRDPSENAATALHVSKDRSAGERLMTEILVMWADGNLEDCVALLWSFSVIYPDDPYAQHLLGLIQNDLEQSEDAVETLRELIRNHPDFVPAWNHLGYAFLELGKMVPAKAAFEMYIELSPDNPSAHDSYAEILAREGNVEEAVRQLSRAVELEPRMAYAWMHMGDILVDAGAVAEAESAYQNAVDASILYGDEFRITLGEKIAEITRGEQD